MTQLEQTPDGSRARVRLDPHEGVADPGPRPTRHNGSVRPTRPERSFSDNAVQRVPQHTPARGRPTGLRSAPGQGQ